MKISKPVVGTVLGLIGVLVFCFASLESKEATADSTKEPVVVRDLPYVPGSTNSAQTLDLYIPAGIKQKTPTVVFIHGGGWVAGSKKDVPVQQLLAHGYIVASINYRLTDQAIFPAQIYDCKAAVRWLRANAEKYKIDPDKIGAWGASAGGHLTALLDTSSGDKALEGDEGNLTFSSAVQAACDFNGPANLLHIAKQVKGDNLLQVRKRTGIVAKLFDGFPEEKQSLAKMADPGTYAKNTNPPMLIMHGDADDVVPLAQSEELYDTLKEAGAPVWLIVVNKGTHNLFSPECLDAVVKFFDKHLR